jgi:hypothetical protein
MSTPLRECGFTKVCDDAQCRTGPGNPGDGHFGEAFPVHSTPSDVFRKQPCWIVVAMGLYPHLHEQEVVAVASTRQG